MEALLQDSCARCGAAVDWDMDCWFGIGATERIALCLTCYRILGRPGNYDEAVAALAKEQEGE